MTLFFILFLLAGIALIVGGRKIAAEALRAAAWPVTEGLLEHCEVVEVPATRSDDFGSWRLELRYAYVVRGVTYHSSRYAFGYGNSSDDAKHRLVAARLKSSAKLQVHYDPVRPREAVLSTEVPSSVIMLGYFCLVLAGISALLALAGQR